jgi:AbrB family looped-hinge helix DNA binding protein
MTSVTLSSKFQLSIPKAIRDEMQLQPGQKFAIIPKGDTIVLAPIRPLAAMRGILKGADTSGYRDRTDRLERHKGTSNNRGARTALGCAAIFDHAK